MIQYPKQSAFGKVLPKSKIYQHARVTRRVQQCFVDQVSRIVWQYKLSPETTNLPARAGVPEIQVFTIVLKTEELNEDVLRCIDKAISFPILYEVTFEGGSKRRPPTRGPAKRTLRSGWWETTSQRIGSPPTPSVHYCRSRSIWLDCMSSCFVA